MMMTATTAYSTTSSTVHANMMTDSVIVMCDTVMTDSVVVMCDTMMTKASVNSDSAVVISVHNYSATITTVVSWAVAANCHP